MPKKLLGYCFTLGVFGVLGSPSPLPAPRWGGSLGPKNPKVGKIEILKYY